MRDTDDAAVGRAITQLHYAQGEISSLTPRLDAARQRKREAIVQALDAGAPISSLARLLGVSNQRIHNLAIEQRKRS